MTLQERIQLLSNLGDYIQTNTDAKQLVLRQAEIHNRWFSPKNLAASFDAIAQNYLTKDKLEAWTAQYPQLESIASKTVGLVLAGNIPAVGFHDLLAVFIAGHKALVKLSSKDNKIIPFFIQYLYSQDERVKEYIQLTEQLKGFNAVIATGSNNSALYFERYFSKVPNIIRKNRNSVAILSGHETKEELDALAQDIFAYYGLGCRSVSKLYLPQGFDMVPLMAHLDHYSPEMMRHDKYKNNYDYNRSIFLLNKVKHYANDSIAMIEHESLQSRIATLHYSFYEDLTKVEQELIERRDEIQCVCTQLELEKVATFALGKAQQPALHDYADNIDSLEFLTQL